MQWEILIIALLYVFGLSIVIGLYLRKKQVGQSGDSFLYGDKSLSPWMAGITIALAGIGSLHVVGMMESGGTMGLVALWFGVAAGIVKAINGAFLAPYYRKVGANTIPEIAGKLFDFKSRLVASFIGLIICFAILSLETQGGGVILAGITGIDVRIALFIFMLCAVSYMMISGMMQVTYLNLINVILTYIVIIISFIIVSFKLPLGWSGVEYSYVEKGLSEILKFWPSDTGMLLGFAIAVVIALIMSDSIDQGMMQYVLSAKDIKSARKANFISIGFNIPFAFFTIAFGLAAMSLPEFAVHGPKLAGISMLLAYLPWPIAGLLLASFLVIVLSTWSRFTMGISQIIINDFFLVLSSKPDKEKLVPMLSRVIVIIAGLAAIIPAFFLPNILLSALFAFSLATPLFITLVIGLFWKRNSNAAFWTMVITLIISFVWEYGKLQSILGFPGWFGTTYVSLVCSLILGIGLTFVLPGERGFFSRNSQLEKDLVDISI